MRDKLGDKQRLIHISEAAGSIQDFLLNVSKEQFLNNYMLQLAVLKLLENIGEAANRLSKELREEFNDIDWTIIIRSRNVYVH
ncbi:MAG TPA: DUF86 domain-containing protein [Cyclobacteriaceae bacterium]|nr:DUF86 domain-containing protein [Cyclobacteriaceae bacterium]